MQVIEIRWVFDIRRINIPWVQLAVRCYQTCPIAATMFDFTIDFFEHSWDDIFLFDSLNFRSGRPDILQKYWSPIGFATLKIKKLSCKNYALYVYKSNKAKWILHLTEWLLLKVKVHSAGNGIGYYQKWRR